MLKRLELVTPHVGVWIETCLDLISLRKSAVTPHVGVWIETAASKERRFWGVSLPMWACGLKHLLYKRNSEFFRHSPCGSVD